jgi:hypothetical protein
MKVLIKRDVYRKIMYWVNKSKFEVSGLGILSLDAKTNTFTVEDAILLKQENSFTHTDIEPEHVAKAMFELRNAPGMLNFWWHSHVDMDVFWSSTDKDTIEKIGAGGWFLSTVFNKKHERRSALYVVNGQKTPFGTAPLFLDEIPTEIEKEFCPYLEVWDKEYEEKVINLPEKVTSSFPEYHSRFGMHGTLSSYEGYGKHRSDVFKNLPLERPEGMSKRQWKRLKKRHNKSVIDMQPVSEAEVQGEEETPLTPSEQAIADDYGFTPEQWQFLGSVGASIKDIDELCQDGYDNDEILQAYGFGYEDTGVELDEYEEDDELEDDSTPMGLNRLQ